MGKKIVENKFISSMIELQKEQVSFIILKEKDKYKIDFIPININSMDLFLCSCNENKFLWFMVEDLLIKCKNCNKIYEYSLNEIKALSKPVLKKMVINKLKGSSIYWKKLKKSIN
tara:strand:- start:539 stop:883 length:345 start_codon:yes stop_codon:yes gene_type:complete